MPGGECWKLVRDRVAREIAGEGRPVRRLEGRELEEYLLAKIVEEARELAETGDPEEAGDLLEALLAWARLRGLTLADIERIAAAKRRERGGFDEGLAALVDCVGPQG